MRIIVTDRRLYAPGHTLVDGARNGAPRHVTLERGIGPAAAAPGPRGGRGPIAWRPGGGRRARDLSAGRRQRLRPLPGSVADVRTSRVADPSVAPPAGVTSARTCRGRPAR